MFEEYEKLNKVIQESGIWEGKRSFTHHFFLSPSVYKITQKQKQELQKLGFALHGCLSGLSHIAGIALDEKFNYQGAWRLARKIFSTGVPSAYLKTQKIKVKNIPAVLKVDLMVNQKGEFVIAEIDGHNKHGIGYSTLAKLFRQALYPMARSLPGTVELLSDEIRRRGESSLKLFYAEQERFYIPEMEITCQEFQKNKINCQIKSEMEADKEFVSRGVFLDLPFLYRNEGLYETIISAYQKGDVKFIIPPKPFFSAKGILGLIRNDTANEELEALLLTFIKKESLELLRRYIPETFLIGKMATMLDEAKKLIEKKEYVLKESISSGMKGTVFSEDNNFEKTLKMASKTKLNWILQEEVSNQSQKFSWYKNGNGSLENSDGWFMRVTAQYVNYQLADIIVTARQNKAVHGAKDCIQIGTVII